MKTNLIAARDTHLREIYAYVDLTPYFDTLDKPSAIAMHEGKLMGARTRSDLIVDTGSRLLGGVPDTLSKYVPWL